MVPKIQATKEIFQILKNDFIFEPRNEIEVKGKGKMETFWLMGRQVFEQLPIKGNWSHLINGVGYEF